MMTNSTFQPMARMTAGVGSPTPLLPSGSVSIDQTPERQRLQWFASMLDELDHGMLLLGSEGSVLHVNRCAAHEMDSAHPLLLSACGLRARRGSDAVALRSALQAAHRLQRMLLLVGEGDNSVSVAIVPMMALDSTSGAAVLVVLGKRQMCCELSVQWFSRNHSLTPAESRILGALCAGDEPVDIAVNQGVSLHTVRTQIGSIRSKTGTATIRDLIRRVSMLPPLVDPVRDAGPHRASCAEFRMN